MSLVITIDVEYPERPGREPLAVFDDLLAVIDRHQVPVTFLVQGRWALAYPSQTAALLQRGHSVGLHGHAHVDYRRLSSAGVAAELQDGVAALRGAVPGHEVRWCRLPYGHGASDPDIAARLREAGLVPLGWDRSGFDWDASLSDEAALQRLLPAVDEGGVVLFHSWPARTPRLLDSLLSSGGAAQVTALDDVELRGSSPRGRTLHIEPRDLPR